MAIAANCPSCGAPIRFTNKATLFVVCDHCGCAVLRTNVGLENLGKIGELADDGTPIQIGTTGVFQGRSFNVLGRLQVHFPDGYWNEWFLDFDRGEPGWLGEAIGNYTISFPLSTPVKVPPFDALTPGQPLTFANTRYFVKTLDRAEVVAAEGELPFRTEGGWPVPSADLTAEEGRFATIDYSDEPPRIYVGWHVEMGDLHLTNLRRVEGW